MRILLAALGLSLIALPAGAQRWFPEAGTHAYRYEVARRLPDRTERHRLDYDLVSDGKSGLVAVVRSLQQLEDAAWKDDPIADSCRTALHAGPGELARVTLQPLAPAAAELGEPFLAMCAPQELFLALSDILNIALIQSPHFGIEALAKPGDARRFAAFESHFERPGLAADASSPGGTIRFVEAVGSRATIDWAPDPMTLRMRLSPIGQPRGIGLEGSERFVFRLVIDRATGNLIGMTAPQDRLDLIVDIKDVPPQPVVITRDVSIVPRPS